MPTISGDTNPKALKPSTATIPRPISQISNAGYFDGVSLEKMPNKASETRPRPGRGQLDGPAGNGGGESPKRPSSPSASHCSGCCPSDQATPTTSADEELSYDALLPQALSHLDAEVVDFICDVIQDDRTSELPSLVPTLVDRFHARFVNQSKPLKRKQKSRRAAATIKLQLEWKVFVEQSLFYVLSDPQRLVRSFTKTGQLYDSQTLWYCMVRMTQVEPSLVFHCLWMAAEVLFAPPKSVQSLRSPTARLFPRQERTLPNSEAGILMSICLHALVAAIPVITDVRELYDMSRIRSYGLSLAGGGAVAKQPSALCLLYADAFSNDLVMRLARRLFAAIPTRRYFDELVEHDSSQEDDGNEQPLDVLSPLFAQLDFLNMDSVYILNFSFSDRVVHETRVPTLLLDWARAVMLNDWDGLAEVPGDGPFGGALALIETMCRSISSFEY